MNKFILIFLLLLPFFAHNKIVFAQDNQEYYAKIESRAFFYSSPNSSSPLFELPSSYFVLVYGQEDDFYNARYKQLDGYVKTSEVSVMNGVPTHPFTSATFSVFEPHGLGLYSSPTSKSTLLGTIPYLENNIEFFGYLSGEELVPDKSDQWYYCSFGGQNGYVSSVFCYKLPTILQNTESFDVVTPNFSPTSSQPTLSKTSLALIIVGVGLPCLAVLFLLVKPTLIKEKLIEKKHHTKRRGDYYEFDDSSLN